MEPARRRKRTARKTPRSRWVEALLSHLNADPSLSYPGAERRQRDRLDVWYEARNYRINQRDTFARADRVSQDARRMLANIAAVQQQPRPPFPAPPRLEHLAIPEALRQLAVSGRLRDLWCCPTCAHFYLVEHDRRVYCRDACRREAESRRAAPYMRAYRQIPRVKLRTRRRKTTPKSKKH